MGRSLCCPKEGLNRGAWTAMEDGILTEYIKIHGKGKWGNLPKRAGLKRCGKSCRLRWLNYLRPDIKRGNITRDEEELIIRLHKLLGNRWSLIAGRLPGRTDNEIKNYYITKLRKKLQNQKNQQFPYPCPLQVLHQPYMNKESSLIQKPVARSKANTSVVWTKASRCNKVILPREQLINEANKPLTVARPPAAAHLPAVNSPYRESIPQFTIGETGFPDLTVDFEIDEQLLSDLLNTDFLELTNFDTGAASDTNISSQNLMFPDDAPNASDHVIT